MNAKTTWITVGAASVLGFGLLAGGAVANASTMPLDNRSGDRVGTGISFVDERANDRVELTSGSTATDPGTAATAAASTPSPASAVSAASPVSAQSAASPISPVSAQSAASPLSVQSPASPASPVSAQSAASPVSN